MLVCEYTLATPILILSPSKLPTRARPTSAYFDASLSQHSYYSSLVRTELGERGEPGTQFLFKKDSGLLTESRAKSLNLASM
jgi:hypothetical protein